MKLCRNHCCPIHRSVSCCGREPAQKGTRVRRLGVQRIEELPHPRGYRELRSKAEMRKLLNSKLSSRIDNVRSVRSRSPTTTTSCPTTLIREGWAGRGETTIRRTFRQCTGGVTARRDPRGNLRYCRSAFRVSFDRVLNPGYKPCFGAHITQRKEAFHVSDGQ